MPFNIYRLNCIDIKEKLNLKKTKLDDLRNFLRFNKFLKEQKLSNITNLRMNNTIPKNIIDKEIESINLCISKLVYKIKSINDEIDDTLTDISCLEDLYILKIKDEILSKTDNYIHNLIKNITNYDIKKIELALKNYSEFNNLHLVKKELHENIELLEKIISSSAGISGWLYE
tara:strand:- start:150 stop:668 length:519 start_codon:yes stop_codon:yes gene_type:complete